MATEGIETAMTPMTGENGVMGYHAEMMAQVLIGLGRLEAKVDSMAEEDKAEDAGESEIETEDATPLSTNPALYSTQLEFDLPPLF